MDLPGHLRLTVTMSEGTRPAEPQANPICAGLEAKFWHQVEVLSFVRRTQNISDYYCKETEVDQWVGQPIDLRKNYLMNYMLAQHLFVLIVYRGKVYLCDGMNHSVGADVVRGELAKRLRVDEVGFIRYDGQTNPTHCTNSCVLIMIELLKLFKRKVETLPQVISVPRYMREKLVNRIHRKDSRRPSLGTRPGSKD